MTQWTQVTGLREYSRVLLRKMAFIALGWVLLYFISHPFRGEGALILFAPMLGAIGGLIAGWYMATDAVEDAGMSGMTLWVILVVASILPMVFIEWIMHFIFKTWEFGFGGWMLVSAGMLLALATAVWHASSQE